MSITLVIDVVMLMVSWFALGRIVGRRERAHLGDVGQRLAPNGFLNGHNRELRHLR